MQHPLAQQQHQQQMKWSSKRFTGFEQRNIQNVWGNKQVLSLKAEQGNRSAQATMLRFHWFDGFRQNDDGKTKAFMQWARQGREFRDSKRPYPVSKW